MNARKKLNFQVSLVFGYGIQYITDKQMVFLQFYFSFTLHTVLLTNITMLRTCSMFSFSAANTEIKISELTQRNRDNIETIPHENVLFYKSLSNSFLLKDTRFDE